MKANRMKSGGFAWVFALAILFAAPDQALAVINFDELVPSAQPPPGNAGLFPADQYFFDGILFDMSIQIQDVEASAPSFFNDFFLPGGGTGSNALALNNAWPIGDLKIAIGMFIVNETADPAVTDFVQVDAFDGNLGTSIGMLEAFDIGGALIESVSGVTDESRHARFTINAPGIASIRLTQDDDGGLFNNLTFNAPVPIPEPGTFLLLAAGLVGIVITGARRSV